MNHDPFTAILHPKIAHLLSERQEKIFEWVQGLGTPLHLIFPDIFAENVHAIKSLLSQHAIKHQVFYAKKANKSTSIISECKKLQLGIDVASVEEFELALKGAIQGRNIGVSGAHKSASLLTLAVAHNALIAVDSINELHSIIAIAQRTDSSPREAIRILLRMQTDKAEKSRFGLVSSELDTAFTLCLEHRDLLTLHGFSCHLSGYSTIQRGLSIHTLCEYIQQAIKTGLSPTVINIGGGLPVSYLQNEQWHDAINYEYFHKNKQFKEFYPYFCDKPGASALNEILASCNQQGKTAAHVINEHNLILMLEPGRALLDQAGISLFSILGSKPVHGTSDCHIATVSGSSLSLSEQWFGSEFLPSPKLLTRNTFANFKSEVRVAFGGATCLENDMLSWRFITFPTLPEANDLIAYINTAGYQMDSNESEFHSMSIPRKVAITFEHQQLNWQLET